MLFAAALFTLLGALFLYLVAPQQKLLQQTCAPWTGWAGLLMTGVSLVFLLQVFGAATAVFVQLTVLMLLWSTVPVWVAYQRTGRASDD